MSNSPIALSNTQHIKLTYLPFTQGPVGCREVAKVMRL